MRIWFSSGISVSAKLLLRTGRAEKAEVRGARKKWAKAEITFFPPYKGKAYSVRLGRANCRRYSPPSKGVKIKRVLPAIVGACNS